MFEFAYLYSVRNGRKYGAIPDFGHNNILLAEKLQVYSAEATDGQYCEFKNWTHKKQWKGNNSTHNTVPGTCPIGIQPISSDTEEEKAEYKRTVGPMPSKRVYRRSARKCVRNYCKGEAC